MTDEKWTLKKVFTTNILPDDPVILSILGCAFLIGILAYLRSGNRPERYSAPVSTASTDTEERTAIYAGIEMAKKLLSDHLKAPSQAKYPKEETSAVELPRREGTQLWRVSGPVDAPNEFGAAIRMKWTVVVASKDGKLFPAFASLNGKTIFGDSSHRQ